MSPRPPRDDGRFSVVVRRFRTPRGIARRFARSRSSVVWWEAVVRHWPTRAALRTRGGKTTVSATAGSARSACIVARRRRRGRDDAGRRRGSGRGASHRGGHERGVHGGWNRTLVVAIGAVAIGLVTRTRGWIGARVEGALRARSRWCFPVARSGRSRRQPRERRRHPVCGSSHMALSRSCGHLELTTALTTTATTHRLGTSPSPCHVLHPHITPTERWVVRGTSPSRGTPMPD